MKSVRIVCIVAALFAITGATSSVVAWEFSMGGLMEWKYQYVAQQGERGFFGNFDFSNRPLAFAARANAWLGIEDYDGLFYGKHPGLVSGSDASRSSVKLELYPVLKINKAITVYSKYRIGGHFAGNNDLTADRWDDVGPFNTEYVNFLVPGQNNAQSFGEWSMLWITARTPWGTLSFGKRPFPVGCGLLYNGEDATQESLMLVAPWGPLRIGAGFYPMTIGHGDFYDLPRRPYTQFFYFGLPFFYFPNQFWDKNGRPNKVFGFLGFLSGPVSMGVGAQYTSLHFGPEAIEIEEVFVPTIDQNDLEGWLYAKYNNGRFFFNAEIDFINRIRKYQPTPDGDLPSVAGPDIQPLDDGGGSFFAPEYVDSWRWMVEAGFFAGPAKVSFLYAFLPGPDRRHGILIDRQPTTFMYVAPELADQATWLNRHVGNSSVFRPYSLLLGRSYGAGLNCYDLNGNGCMTDASVLALRLDYAVAANLNLFGSVFYAERASHGWQWGCIRPGGRNVFDVFDGDDDALRQVIFRPRQGNSFDFAEPIPTIPDTALGYELVLGAEWKLIENWLLTVTGAYWQPGRWFNYACKDRGVLDWVFPDPATLYGINPNRTIDPIVGLEITMEATF